MTGVNDEYDDEEDPIEERRRIFGEADSDSESDE